MIAPRLLRVVTLLFNGLTLASLPVFVTLCSILAVHLDEYAYSRELGDGWVTVMVGDGNMGLWTGTRPTRVNRLEFSVKRVCVLAGVLPAIWVWRFAQQEPESRRPVA